MHAVFDPVDIQLDIETVPFERAQRMVEDKQADTILAVSPATGTYCLYSKRRLDFLIVIALYHPSKIPEWNGIDSLVNKKVWWVGGYGFHKFLSADLDYQELTDLQNAMEMLRNNRLDIILDYVTDIESVATKINMDLTSYSISDLLPDLMYMGFARTNRARKLLAIYDERIESLYLSGKLQKIYLKYGYEFKKDKFEFSYVK